MTVSVAIIGGTGFYEFLPGAEEVSVDTPYGSPSAPVSISEVGGRRVAFIPRHGRKHTFLPSEVPYRANLWALKEIGARQIVAFNAVGSLQPNYKRGHFVIADQFVDRTWGRADTFFGGGKGAHVSSADPYCERLRGLAYASLREGVGTVHPTGTIVVIQGPRFSTRAESAWFTSQGWHLVNMTQYPEAVLARELELCYMNLSYVTDYDVGAPEVAAEKEMPVSHHEILLQFSLGSSRVREVLHRLVPVLIDDKDCVCHRALSTATI
jgi:5'-methylthioadenosine phosphorylase